jgi:hypothetical protein
LIPGPRASSTNNFPICTSADPAAGARPKEFMRAYLRVTLSARSPSFLVCTQVAITVSMPELGVVRTSWDYPNHPQAPSSASKVRRRVRKEGQDRLRARVDGARFEAVEIPMEDARSTATAEPP